MCALTETTFYPYLKWQHRTLSPDGVVRLAQTESHSRSRQTSNNITPETMQTNPNISIHNQGKTKHTS